MPGPAASTCSMLGCKEVTATITAIKYREDVNTGRHWPQRTLELNEIATVTSHQRAAGV
jgi:bifunctional enzyme CysN/CysC